MRRCGRGVGYVLCSLHKGYMYVPKVYVGGKVHVPSIYRLYLLPPVSYSYLLPPRECIGTLCIHVDVYVDVDLYLDTHMYI